MPINKSKPTSSGRRFAQFLYKEGVSRQVKPPKKLRKINPKKSGRDAAGKIRVRHRGGRQKRLLRLVDYKRDKVGIPAKVVSIEYDPNRSANVALLNYVDGEKRYIIAPTGLKVADELISGPQASLKTGNALPLGKIPVGTVVHNVELIAGKGGQIVRGAGTGAVVQAREEEMVIIKLPSGELRRVKPQCLATVGQVGRSELKLVKLGKAGRKRLMGWRPSVRGVAQHPGSHPHGGGEGRSSIGMPGPKSPWGKRTLGKKTRKKKKYSDKLIIKSKKR